MGYKIITMKRQLLLYLIKLFMGIVIIIICWLALTNIFVECGVIIPANYSETILEENRKRLDDIQQITDNDLPYGSKYSIFDLDYNYERGTMNKSDIEVTKKILLGKESNLQGNYVYSVIARTEEYCVIKYNIKARFNSDNKIFNYIDYDNLSYITMVLAFIISAVTLTSGCANGTPKTEEAKSEQKTTEENAVVPIKPLTEKAIDDNPYMAKSDANIHHDCYNSDTTDEVLPVDIYPEINVSYETVNKNASPAVFFDTYGHAVVPLQGGLAIRDINADEAQTEGYFSPAKHDGGGYVIQSSYSFVELI